MTNEEFFNGKPRFLTHLSTDKPIYKPGETVYIRGVLLHAITRNELKNECKHNPRLEVISPSGDKALEISIPIPTESTLSAYWNIPISQKGGDYKIRVTYLFDSDFATCEREFNIRAFRAPRLKTQLKFLQKGYGPGQEASAVLEVFRAEGGVPENAAIEAIARVDGNEIYRGNVKLNKEGNCTIKFTLPSKIETGDGTLVCSIQDGGVVESASKTIPILLQTMDVKIYPEGGDLIAGLENTFYVEAFTRTGEPADITAEIIEVSSGSIEGNITTEHEGRGKSHFVPKDGKSYKLRIVKPTGIINEISFPKVCSGGVVLHSVHDVYQAEKPLELQVTITENGNYEIHLYKVDARICTHQFSTKSKETISVKLPTNGMDGILRVTVFKQNVPVAERLVFVQPKRHLSIQIEPNKNSYIPAENVQLKILVKDDLGKPVQKAHVGITVTDDSVLEMIEKRKQAPRLPAMALLESDVDHLEDAQFYFNTKEPKANTALDLLLGTQGWRRFLFNNAEILKALQNDDQKKYRVERVTARHVALIPPEELEFEEREEDEGEEDECEVEGRVEFEDEDELQEEKAVKRAKVFEIEERKNLPLIQAPKPVIEAPAIKAKKEEINFEMEEDDVEMGEAEMLESEEEVFSSIQNQNIIREYAHKTITPVGRERSDFTETIYWNACVITDSNGIATVNFSTSHSITGFKAIVDAHANTLLGTQEILLESKEPFYVEPKLPLEVTGGDIIYLPISLVNSSPNKDDGNMNIIVKNNLIISEKSSLKFTLKPEERKREIVQFRVNNGLGDASLTLESSFGPFRDSVTRSTKVAPCGFPFSNSSGGTLDANSKVRIQFEIPKNYVVGSATTNIKLLPSPSASLSASLSALLREPGGCFEQTSSTSYPLVMALQYFLSHPETDPKYIRNATEKLEKAYKRLAGYECKNGGFEWFGDDPGHEALTAYGLTQFIEMSRVLPIVEKEMVERTKKWLIARKDNKGGFLRNAKALDSFGGAPEDVTNAYITWSLAESGIDVTNEINNCIQQSKSKNHSDSYIVGLICATLYKIGRLSEANEFSQLLIKFQRKDGSIQDEKTTITRSGGISKIVESTSIGVLSLLNDPKHIANATLSIRYIQSLCQNGNFGSTQATILALKAIIAYDKAAVQFLKEGSVIARIDGEEVSSIGWSKIESDALEFPSFKDKINAGKHVLELEMIEGNKMPYLIAIEYFAVEGEKSKECVVDLKLSLASSKIKEGEGTEIKFSLVNTTDKGQPMTVAIIGLPGGLELRHEKLKEMVKAHDIDFYETMERNLILYWRCLKPNDKRNLKIDVLAAIPGKFTGPASRAYLYYTAEHKVWISGLQVEVLPK